ncbi:ABC transporter permease [Agrilutibacter solisilvae]|uniref:ABC-2 transporter permease n=1 Tax=Agrilutibacter solisilvae TaxID=2763317 RepID=A0A974XZK4_9GAMM|nr:ABC-2 transporter permease [Lysobacter solisilvae]QSX78686.1 ABC-2 transporter permease [Lysobacter solisilvae]
MNLLRATGAILRADLLQRLRSPRYWLVMFSLGAFMWWCLPPADADYMTVVIGDSVRGRYSSAWVGMAVALVYSPLLSLAGFYLVRGTLTRDIDTRAWQLLVTTTMSRRAYLIAKWLSHLAVFAGVLLVGLVFALALQVVRGEDRHIDLLELLKPVVLITMPALAVTATLAVWFDLVPWLRRSAGNVVFFFVFFALVSVGTSQANRTPDATPPFPGDLHGLVDVEYDMSHRWPAASAVLAEEMRVRAAAEAKAKAKAKASAEKPEPGSRAEPGGDAANMETPGLSIGKLELEGRRPTLVDWPRWQVSGEMLVGRAFWFGGAFLVLLLATPLLDRFASRTSAVRTYRGASLRWLDWLLRPLQHGSRGALLASELRLVLRSRRWWWWLAMAIVSIVQLAAPREGLAIAILVAWMLSLDVFSRLVLREHDTRTAALVFTAPGMRTTLLVTRVVMAIGLAWLVTLPALLRLSMQDPVAAAATAVAGASLALWGLALGALFRNARPFELSMLAAGYISVQGALVLNTLVASQTTLAWHAASIPMALALLVTAWRQGLAARA